MKIRLKVFCNFKQEFENFTTLYFSPVYSGSEENKKFFQLTPGGQICFNAVNKEISNGFGIGKEYYVELFPAGEQQ